MEPRRPIFSCVFQNSCQAKYLTSVATVEIFNFVEQTFADINNSMNTKVSEEGEGAEIPLQHVEVLQEAMMDQIFPCSPWRGLCQRRYPYCSPWRASY